ncbi:hypothetical protein IAG44_01895 [Streptomyces roseirectus]|uniref:Circularly permuted type 2 ATP-grasp protein n=1 Tax=Streptomyces roseirectus TaxID=2768066 RepID=A0A7H0I6C8_9ACTN|nr:hypothetical protein [Streptomyces roseirectus]QNP68344.1 hypothetical protein IAG44_01895 [Streptomyces roseirectus]
MAAPAESPARQEEDPGPGLVDWRTALDVGARLVDAAEDGLLADAVRQAQDRMPAFRNRAYPLSPLPLFVHAEAATCVARQLEPYVRLLSKVARLYLDDAGVRRWYGLPPAADLLIAAEAHGDGPERTEIGVCRLDGYLEQDSGRLRILENNADAPAGTLFTPRIHAVVRSVLDTAGITVPPHALRAAPRDDALLDAVRPALTAARREGRTPVLAVLQPDGAANRESVLMAGAFQAQGIDAFVADPREVTPAGGRARVGRRTLDACWNKVNTVGWQRLVQDDPGLVARWARILRETDLRHVNSFLARYVAESKLTLALVQEPAFATLFEEDERRLAALLLPWSRRAEPAGGLPEQLMARQHEYVLKEPYDIRGDGVTIGRAVSREAWAEAVGRAVKEGGVAQRYVPPAAYPVVRTDTDPRVVAMPVSFDTYVIRGTVAFHGSKASLQPRVNIFQGGQKLSVHVTTDSTGGEGLR